MLVGGNDDDVVRPEYRNFIVFCDESGLHGSKHYGFGTLWLPYERRGDLYQLVEKHRRDTGAPPGEIKWMKTKRATLKFYKALVDAFIKGEDARLVRVDEVQRRLSRFPKASFTYTLLY